MEKPINQLVCLIMSRTKFIIILIFFFINKTYCQKLIVPLTNKYDTGNIYSVIRPTVKIDNIKYFVLKDTILYKSWQVRSLSFENAQVMKEQVLDNKITEESYLKYVKYYKIDTTYVINRKLPKNSVYVLIGINNKAEKCITVDANNNYDFTDDSTYKFNYQIKTYPIIKIEFDYFNGSEIKTKKLQYTIEAYNFTIFDNSINSNENDLNVSFINNSYKEGYVSKNKKKYLMKISNQYYDLFKNRQFFINIKSVPLDSTVNNNYLFKSDDLIDFDGKDMYKIDSLTKDSLYLSFQYRALYEGAKVNSKSPAIVANDYVTSKLFSLYAQKGSFVVMDFWGTWCKPCIEALPDLVALRNKYKSKDLRVISLAYDNVSDIATLKTLVVQKKLDWNHVLIDKKGKKTILEDYKVQAFPSVFLIDPKGMILIRGEGKDVIGKIDQYLEGTFRQK